MPSNWPSGLTIVYDFIDEDTEKEILRLIPPYAPPKAYRRAFRFGPFDVGLFKKKWPEKKFRNQYVRPDFAVEWLPPVLSYTGSRFKPSGLLTADPTVVMINEYTNGKGIAYHIDHPINGEEFAIVGLLADSPFLMRPKGEPDKEVSIGFPRRAAFVMKGDARWNWEHSIPSVQKKRYSAVFRPIPKES